MTAEQLRAMREANPFRPFTIHLADGRTLLVPLRRGRWLHGADASYRAGTGAG